MAYIIGLAGGSASGKSTFLAQLKAEFDNKIAVLSQDDFYKSIDFQQKDQQGVYNFDLPDAIDFERFNRQIQLLKNGHSVEFEEYTFNHPEKKGEIKRILAADILLVEGLFVFHMNPSLSLFDLSLFIYADEAIRYQRRKLRDTVERGISEETLQYQWKNHVEPAYHEYLELYKNKVDLVINNNASFQPAYTILCDHIYSKLKWQTNSQ